MSSQQVMVVKDKVQRYLTDDFLNHVEVDSDGDFSARHGSARIFIRVVEHGEDRTLVTLMVPLILEVQHSSDLYKHIALHSTDYLFGSMGLVDRGDHCDIMLTHVLLGDFLDPAELKDAVGFMLTSAEELDDELQKSFGGTRFHEDG
jgi:hypothetical protein